jgi:vitamin B12 transporter
MSPGDGTENADGLFINRTVHILRHFACDLFCMLRLLPLFCLFTSRAQDTVSLKGVDIVVQKSRLSQTGKKTEVLDSTLQQQFKFNSIGEALSANTPVFIKSYGPGGIATTAFRGGNASQTAVLWNGFNIQNAMLGQSDLTLMPAVLFENVEVEYGGSSSLWGSGAVGGSIHLNNKSPFGAGLLTTTNLGGGSFGTANGSTNILVSRQRFVSSTKLYGLRSENNFSYKDTLDKEQPLKRQKNNGYAFRGLMQEFKILMGARHILSFNAWINDNDRRLPAANPSLGSRIYQEDKALRLTTGWNYSASRFRSTARLGFFEDHIDYTDSLAPVFSKSKVQTWIAENENYWNWHSDHQLHFGLNASSSSGSSSSDNSVQVTNRYDNASISRLSLLAGNRFSFFERRLAVYVAGRAEYFSVGTLPVTGNVSAEYRLLKRITAKINTARVYRQPTLNELYWNYGGNPDLKPEQGHTLEGELNYRYELEKFSLFVSGAAFSRKINDWILWVPGPNGNPVAMNIQQVWSRGTETTWRLNYQAKKWKLGLNLVTGYVLSTIESNRQENSNTLERQLVYTPRYTVNGNLSVGYGNFQAVVFHQYVGYRFTSSDNTQWLMPYHLSSLKLNYNLPLKKMRLVFFAACNNLLNSNYSVVAGRPMPLRNYEAGITLQTKHKLNKPQP